ncbi:NADP-dependent malic enzyme 1 [Forsythia ovata]|uniref:NADP-dependent malic enzyme 1 n=1 Tax=Forsythia ovata TaxID=205694 RepID=A0ABD1R7S1_9LAMI
MVERFCILNRHFSELLINHFDSGYSLLRDPHHNKGLAFTGGERERDVHYFHGLLPPAVIPQELQERNEKLFYKVLIDNVEELLPVVYTPTVGEACQKCGSIFRRLQGLYISLKEKGKILEVLKNWPERTIQVIVVTDSERILGLRDLGCQGMGIPVGKLALHTALGGVRPSACLPITIDVGTNDEQLLKDDFYIGLRQKQQNYGEKVLVQVRSP